MAERSSTPSLWPDHSGLAVRRRRGHCAESSRRAVDPIAALRGLQWGPSSPPEHVNAGEQSPHNEVAEGHVPEQLPVGSVRPIPAAVESDAVAAHELVEIASAALQLIVNRLSAEQHDEWADGRRH